MQCIIHNHFCSAGLFFLTLEIAGIIVFTSEVQVPFLTQNQEYQSRKAHLRCTKCTLRNWFILAADKKTMPSFRQFGSMYMLSCIIAWISVCVSVYTRACGVCRPPMHQCEVALADETVEGSSQLHLGNKGADEDVSASSCAAAAAAVSTDPGTLLPSVDLFLIFFATQLFSSYFLVFGC